MAEKKLTAVCPACKRVWRVLAGQETRCTCNTHMPPDRWGQKCSVRRAKGGKTVEVVFAAKTVKQVVRVYK